VLNTLPPRQFANGLAEAIKMAATSDPVLFELLETGSVRENIDTVIERSLRIKKDVVEQDEKETGLRRVLNFGHTLGHAIETCEELVGLYHGECVGLGMLGMCSDAVRVRIEAVLRRVGLPAEYHGDADRILEAMRHDKKMSGNSIHVVSVPEIGQFTFENIPFETLAARMKNILE
jgi:3-dehydroquinate synthase